MGTQFSTSLEANCSTMKVLIITGFCLSSILSPVFGGSGSGSGVGYGYGQGAGSGYGGGMPGECCPLKAIMGQKYCMAPSDDSEVMCLWEGMGMSGYGSMMSGYGSMMSGYGSGSGSGA